MTGANQGDLLRSIVAEQAAAAVRLDEMSRSVVQATSDAREARDAAREVATIMREQNALVKVAEARADAASQIAALRQDVVKANGNLKSDIADHTERLTALEKLRNEGQGMARLVRIGGEVVKIALAAGGGALLIKLFGGS